MADKKISELTNITGSTIADADEFVVVDASANETKAITASELRTAIGNGDFTVTGNLTVQGTTITVDSASAQNIVLGDNDKMTFGDAVGGDLRIYHDGQHSRIDEQGTGVLFLQTNGNNIQLNKGTSENMLVANVDGSVDLYYDNSKKLATTATGVDITGVLSSDGLTVDGTANLQGTNPDLYFIESDTTDLNAYIANGSGNLTFYTANDAKSSFKQRFNIDHSTGDISFYEDTGTTAKFFWDASLEALGVGITPSTAMHIYSGSGNTALRVETGLTNGQAEINFKNDARRYNVGINSSDNLHFVDDTAGATRMTIDSSGRVGIGTSSPNEKLVSSGTVRALGATISNESSTTLSYNAGVGGVEVRGPDTSTRGSLNLYQAASNGSLGQTALHINSSGNVGIGTSSPTLDLSVDGDIWQGNGGGVELGRVFNDAGVWHMRASGNVNGLAFGTNNTERMRIDSSGLLNVYYGISVDGGTIKLDGNYPVGTNNVALGDTALDAVDSGAIANTAVGHGAATALISGDENTAIGNAALATATTAINNTAVGSLSLQDTTSGSYNVAVGKDALQSNTTASNNTAVGYRGGYSNTTGTNLTTLGYQAGYSNTTGVSNTAIGTEAALITSTGSYNTSVGVQALYSNTTASNNTAVGCQAGYSNTTGAQLTVMGAYALEDNTTGSDNSAFGLGSLGNNTSGSYNTSVGKDALRFNTTASYNTAVGYQAGYANTTGALTAFGSSALKANTTGDYNHAFGESALLSNTTGTANVAVGGSSLRTNTTGAYNVAMGDSALRSNTTASNNTAIGYQAGNTNTTGLYNTLIGSQTGFYLTTGSGNTFIGGPSYTSCGRYVTTGSKNTIIGGYDGNQGGLDIRTSSNNIVLSDGDGNPRFVINSSGDAELRENTQLTLNTQTADQGGLLVQNGSNNTSATAIEFQGWNSTTTGSVSTFVNSTTYSTSSDYRLKENVVDMIGATTRLKQLKPKQFNFIENPETNFDGFLAHEVQEVVPQSVTGVKDGLKSDGTPQYQGIDHSHLVPLLVATIKELEARITALENA